MLAGPRPLGPLIHSFFADHLITVKGLRPASVRSYRDTIRLLLCFAASDKHTKITRLSVEDLTFDRVLGFLRYLEHDRGNHARTRNQRLAALHTLFGYIASRERQMLGTCRQVAAIPAKRAAPAQTRFLERDEVEALFRSLPRKGRLALRDRALLLFLYNTGARVTPEVRLVDGVEHLDGGPLDDLAFQRRDAERPLPPVRLRDVRPPRRTRPVAPLLHPLVQAPEIRHQVLPAGFPGHPVHPRRGLRAQVPVGHHQALQGDVVQQRSEPCFLVPYCHLPHTVQRT